ncbi:MAG: DNA (cytosine-5-)-methyltransferase [Erysipelothrix sp.]|nr:DNA (cytosine-5-)-methyltransferase [Erysipelothrix sp.]
MSIKVVELFAGVGGFRVGLEGSSDEFVFVWANQWEPGKKTQHAFDCYVKHFGDSEYHVNEDISKVKDQIPDHDLLVGGFPCQDYSVAATGAKGIQGKKGVLWWEIRDIVENKRPKMLLLENVDRLVKSPTNQRGRDFGIMLRCLSDLGYTVEWRVINAADYGNAQRRRRVFIFASRNDTEVSNELYAHEKNVIILESGLLAKSFPCVRSSKKPRIVSGNFAVFADLVQMSEGFLESFQNSGVMRNNEYYSIEVEPKHEPPIPLRDILHKEPVGERYFLSSDLVKWEYLKNAKRIPRVKPNGEEYFYSEGPISFPENLDLPSRTMLTSESSLNRSTHVVKDLTTGRLRLLTEIECERLNGFDDNWTNTGMPNKFRYFVMGNALVVNLITRIGKEIVNTSKR